MRHVLHIVNDYSGSKVYKSLMSKLDSENIVQSIYVPVRHHSLINKNLIDFKTKDSNVVFSKILNNHMDKVFYSRKINKITKDIVGNISSIESIDVIHAHTWFSDGAVALNISKQFNLPFIVTIRNTDLNIYYKYLLHLRENGFSVLENASKIIFLSKAYYFRFKNIVCLKYQHLLDKCEIIPNGVDDFWLNNLYSKQYNLSEGLTSFLYVGRFVRSKNLPNLIKAFENLGAKGEKIVLNLVGGGGSQDREIKRLIKNIPNINYLGQVNDKNELMEIYRENHFFVMPSTIETFGLVYIEALLQGLPILYTENEGVDGMYENIGEKVSRGTVSEIEEAMCKMMKNRGFYSFDRELISGFHNWSLIAKRYLRIYEALV